MQIFAFIRRSYAGIVTDNETKRCAKESIDNIEHTYLGIIKIILITYLIYIKLEAYSLF